MKKVNKYIYPFNFSICFFVFYFFLAFYISVAGFDGYGGLGVALLIIALWVLLMVPIYCFMYSKLIYELKWKFLFIIYNSLVVSLCYTGPFLMAATPNGDADVVLKIALALFSWVAICTYVSYLIRINTAKEPDENNSSETEQ